jgi:hypothetical protein
MLLGLAASGATVGPRSAQALEFDIRPGGV